MLLCHAVNILHRCPEAKTRKILPLRITDLFLTTIITKVPSYTDILLSRVVVTVTGISPLSSLEILQNH